MSLRVFLSPCSAVPNPTCFSLVRALRGGMLIAVVYMLLRLKDSVFHREPRLFKRLTSLTFEAM